MASGVVSSITRMGTLEPFDLQVGRGQITFHRAILLNSYTTASAVTLSTLWPKGGVYAFPAAASVMVLYSTNAGDTTQFVQIEGLDANYKEVTEILTLNGQTGRTSTTAFLRINNLIALTGNPAGDIALGTGTPTAGVPTNTYAFIKAGDGRSSMGIYTVPAGWTLHIADAVVSSGTAGTNKYVTVDFRLQPFGGVNYLTSKVTLNGYQSFSYPYPPALAEKSDIFTNVTSSTGTDQVCLVTNGILIKNDSQTP